MTVRWRAVLAAFVVLLAIASSACHRAQPTANRDGGAVSTVVRPDTEGLLLTWIDDKGDFHVETNVGDVPMMGRDAVRVVDPNDQASQQMTEDDVLVVDLRQTGADGTYPVRTMTRTSFEAMAVARREKAGPTLANAAPNRAPSASSTGPASGSDPSRSMRAPVVIYGAEWCGACHDAARYLRHRGIPYIDKDIEKDPAAAREMQQKLAKNGLNAGSIPVIDVRGKVLIGFNPADIDAALGEPL